MMNNKIYNKHGTLISTSLAVLATLLLVGPPASAEDERIHVIIGGAGAAGIGAAFELNQHSDTHRFTVIEANSKLGGRVQSFKFGQNGDLPLDNELTLENGAQWISGANGNPLFDLAKRYGLNYETQTFEISFTYYDESANLVDAPYHPVQDVIGATTFEAFEGSKIISECLKFNNIAEMEASLTPPVYGACRGYLTALREITGLDMGIDNDGEDTDDFSNHEKTSFADLMEAFDPAIVFADFTAYQRTINAFDIDFDWSQGADVVSGKFGHPLNTYLEWRNRDLFVLDRRGFSYVLEALADEFIFEPRGENSINDPDSTDPAERLAHHESGNFNWVDDRLQLNTKIVEVKYDQSGDSPVVVTTCPVDPNDRPNCLAGAAGGTVEGDVFISTFSVGVLKQVICDEQGPSNCSTAANPNQRADSSPVFDPPLSSHNDEDDNLEQGIETGTFANYLKIFMRFPIKFWDDVEVVMSAVGPHTPPNVDNGQFAAIWNSLDLSNQNTWAPASKTLFQLLTGDRAVEAQEIMAASPAGVETIKQQMLDVLNRLYTVKIAEFCADQLGGTYCNMDGSFKTAAILEFHSPLFLVNPLYRGMFFDWSVKHSAADQEAFTKVRGNDTLYISGSATCDRHWAYVHGGLFSGVKAARLIVGDPTPSVCDFETAEGHNPFNDEYLIKAQGNGPGN